MNYVGIDIHKRYSVLAAQDAQGQKLREARIEGNSAEEFARFFRSLAGPSQAVLEACWNWGLTHDLLEEIEEVEEVVLAHPLKTRLIADAQIKTDRLDAFALGTLLRGNLVARAHIPRRGSVNNRPSGSSHGHERSPLRARRVLRKHGFITGKPGDVRDFVRPQLLLIYRKRRGDGRLSRPGR